MFSVIYELKLYRPILYVEFVPQKLMTLDTFNFLVLCRPIVKRI